LATEADSSPRSGFIHGPFAPALILLASSVAISLFFWPGFIDADAIRQMAQARSGLFNDWYSPILDWLWRQLFLLHISPGFVLWLNIAIFLLALYELLRCALSRWTAVAVTLLITAFPPVLGFLGSLQREVWFSTATLASYALVARSYKTTGRQRTVWAVLALVAVWFAIAARLNGIIAVVPVTFMAGAILLRPLASRLPSRHASAAASPRSSRRHWTWNLAFFATSCLLLAIFVLSQRFITYDAIHAQHTYPEQDLLEFDLTSLSVRTGHLYLPQSIFPTHNLKVLEDHYSPYTYLTLVTGSAPPITIAANGKIDTQLEHDWVNAILDHPGAYLRERWQIWTREIAWSGNSYEPFHDGFDPNGWGYRASFPTLDRFMLRYLSSFTSDPQLDGGPFHRVWVYLIIAPVLATDLLRRRRATNLRVIGWLTWAAVVYYLSYFFLAFGVGFRFAWLLVCTTLLALCVDLADRFHKRIESRANELAAQRVDQSHRDLDADLSPGTIATDGATEVPKRSPKDVVPLRDVPAGISHLVVERPPDIPPF
jgi:hypothetical protein